MQTRSACVKVCPGSEHTRSLGFAHGLHKLDVDMTLRYTALIESVRATVLRAEIFTVDLQWLEHVWDRGNVFEIWVVRATEG